MTDDFSINWPYVVVSREEEPEDMDLMINWCYDNCYNKWAYGLQHSGPGASIEYAFYFVDRTELTAFSLIWGLT